MNPTYHSLGDHTESLQIDFDPDQISYEQLLDIFWDSHNPTRGAWSNQYKAAVFVHNEEEARLVGLSKTRIAAEKTGRWFNQQIRTEILPAETFYRQAIKEGTLGKGSIAGDEYLLDMAQARLVEDGSVRWVEVCYCRIRWKRSVLIGKNTLNSPKSRMPTPPALPRFERRRVGGLQQLRLYQKARSAAGRERPAISGGPV